MDADGKRWKVSTYTQRADGTRARCYRNVRGTKTEALEVLEDMKRTEVLDDRTLTFADLVERFLQAKAMRKEPTTVALYRRVLETHAVPRLGRVRVRDLKPAHVESALANARNQRTNEPLGKTTSKNLRTCIGAVLRHGVNEGVLLRNVAEMTDTIEECRSERPEVSSADALAIFAAFAGHEMEPFVSFALASGARRGEIAALQWRDVDLSTGSFIIRRSAKNYAKKVVIGTPKTRKSERHGILMGESLSALRRHRQLQAMRHLRLGLGNLGPEAFVFDRIDGTGWDPNEASRQFSRVVRRENLPSIRLHDLRHAFATNGFAQGADLKTVSEALGHASVTITAKTYIKVLDETRRDLAERIDARLGSAFREVSNG